jgi:hypothetical protein
MESQSATKTDLNWRRAAVGGVLSIGLACSLALGFGSSAALADPANPVDPASQIEISPDMSADQVLAVIAQDYDTGAGGGQVSNLVHSVLQLRAAGIKPSEANRQQIIKSLHYRPNQTPLISALETTLAYQQRKQAQMQTPSNPTTIGINQSDPNNPGVLGGFGVTGGGINQPIG